MMTTMNDPLVAEYLGRLRAATADLPPGEREELVSSIAEHIAGSLAEADPPGEAAVRTILDRLGDPAAIAAEARGQSGGTSPARAPYPMPHKAPARPGLLEWGGVAMLGIGSYLLPVIGTVTGLVMVCLSTWWTTRQKIVAVVLSLLGALVVPVLVAALFLVSRSTTNIEPGGPEQVPAATAPPTR
jgi:uncharacterized membrane protein